MKPGRYPPRCGTRFLDLRDEAEALPHERPDDRHSRLTAADAVETGLDGNASIGALIADPGGTCAQGFVRRPPKDFTIFRQ